MKFALSLLVIGGVLWWLARRRATVTPGTNAATGTAPDANGEALGLNPGAAPGAVPTAYNPADDHANDPVVKIAQAAGLNTADIPTVAEAVARSDAAAAAANILMARGASGPPVVPPDDFVPPYQITADLPQWAKNNYAVLNQQARDAYESARLAAMASAAASTDTVLWNATQQAATAANPYAASTGYNGNAAEVAGQIACGAKASGALMGRVLDSSFCQGGPHYGADPQLSTGVFP